jgi:hypothetical protein
MSLCKMTIPLSRLLNTGFKTKQRNFRYSPWIKEEFPTGLNRKKKWVYAIVNPNKNHLNFLEFIRFKDLDQFLFCN